MSLIVSHLNSQNKDFELKNINMELKEGQLGCIFGKTGCGKSTILRLIAGLDKPSSGSITISNKTICHEDFFLLPENRGLGIVFQHPSLFPHKTVIDNVMFGIKSKKNRKEIALNMLKDFAMDGYKDSFPAELSGGQQQLITIARALVCNPNLLLLDEPFSSLDAILRREMLDKLVGILRDKDITTLFVTHDPEEALTFPDIIFYLREGNIVQQGTPRDIFYCPFDINLAKFFGKVNKLHGAFDEEGSFVSSLGKIDNDRIKEQQCVLCVRPEGIILSKKEGVCAEVSDVKFYNRMVYLSINDNFYWMQFPMASLPKKGDVIKVALDVDQIMLLNSF